MDNQPIYLVTFDTKNNGNINNLVYHVRAANAKQACEAARAAWDKTGDRVPHMFHLHAARCRIQDESLLHIVTWRNAHVCAGKVMNEFYCTDFRTVRR